MQALLPCKRLLGLCKRNTISATDRCTSMRAAPHWTWLAVLTALSRKARLAEHDVPESGRMLFAELLHCVCVVCGLHCFDLLGWIQMFVSCKSNRVETTVERGGRYFKQLLHMIFRPFPAGRSISDAPGHVATRAPTRLRLEHAGPTLLTLHNLSLRGFCRDVIHHGVPRRIVPNQQSNSSHHQIFRDSTSFCHFNIDLERLECSTTR